MTSSARVLIVDDNPELLRVYSRMLVGQGYEIDLCLDGDEAERALAVTTYDVVLSDVDMPKLGGVELLQRIRARDLDVPIVLITGSPHLDTAMHAVTHGAMRYLQKPLTRDHLRAVTAEAVRVNALARAKRSAVEMAGGVGRLMASQATLSESFERALSSLYIAYQPIVSWSNRTVFGYEALLRSREPALPNPPAVLDAAERLGRLHDLGRKVRELAAAPLSGVADGMHLFINLHPQDLIDDHLLDPNAPLSAHASRVVLEVTERAGLHHIADLSERTRKLRALGFKIAIDDLGAGYAGLTTFAQLEPEVTKLDMSLVRDIHHHSTKLTLARTILTMCKGMGTLVVAEGIETADERDALAKVGCDLMQGYFFAKPGPTFAEPKFA